MKIPSARRVILLSIVSALLLLVLGERVLVFKLKQKIIERAQAAGIEVGSISLGVFSRSARVYDLRWPAGKARDSLSTSFEVEKLTIKGLRLFSLIKDHKLSVRSVLIENGVVDVKYSSTTPGTPAKKVNIEGLLIEALTITNTYFSIDTDSLTTWSGNGTITLEMVSLLTPEFPLKMTSYEAPNISLELHDIKMSQVNGFNDLEIGKLTFDRYKKTLTCDSLLIIPQYAKREYGWKKGTQSTWASLLVPHIEATGLDLKIHLDTTLTASKITLDRPRIDAFRDRHVPFRRKSEIPLPMTLLRNLSLALEIDSIAVNDMEVNYEHVSEDAFKPGLLRLSKLDALFLNVNNREYDNLPQVTTLEASSRIMGDGLLKAQFFFPLTAGASYRAKGTVTGLPLANLNPMLENAVFMSVESGTLNELQFAFTYNNDRSEGSVGIDYDDLKVRGLKKDRTGDMDQLKTLLVNTAVRNQGTKEGSIRTERDKRRFIFHYWAASLMDGVRSAVLPAAANGGKKK